MRLKTILVPLLLVVFAAALVSAQAKKPLTNSDIIQMVKAGFTDQTITDAIKANDTAFDTSVQGLMALKNAGVSQSIIDAMLSAEARKRAPVTVANPPKTPSPPAKAASANPSDPMSPHDAGIYWRPKERRDKQLVELEPSVYSQEKFGGMFTMALTYGIKKAKWKAVVRGEKATLHTSESMPEFWFYFEVKSSGLSQSGSYFSGASSPNEFILANMEQKHGDRELIVGQFGYFGSSTGTRPRDVVNFDFAKMAPGIYKVTPQSPLNPGQYGFFYAGTNMATGMAGGKLFDFGIDPPR